MELPLRWQGACPNNVAAACVDAERAGLGRKLPKLDARIEGADENLEPYISKPSRKERSLATL